MVQLTSLQLGFVGFLASVARSYLSISQFICCFIICGRSRMPMIITLEKKKNNCV